MITRRGIVADTVELPSGTPIRAVSPPYLLATKLEVYIGRGNGDHLGSRDFADIVALLDGRAELLEEIEAAPEELRRYVGDTLGSLLEENRILDGIQAQLLPDAVSQERGEDVVLRHLRQIVAAV